MHKINIPKSEVIKGFEWLGDRIPYKSLGLPEMVYLAGIKDICCLHGGCTRIFQVVTGRI